MKHSLAIYVKNTLLSLYFACSLFGCASKAITKPFSEVFKEAHERGISMRSVEEEKIAFFEQDQRNKERLIEVIGNRSKDVNYDKEYRIGPSDEMEITVFDVPELNLKTQVKESGDLSLPLIGIIHAKGLTESELLNQIANRLQKFVLNPQVSLSITNYGSQKVAVVGAVRNPGTYPLKKGLNSVLELIGVAGGLNDKAGNTLNFVPVDISGLSFTNDAASRARLALSNELNSESRPSGIEVYLDNVLGTSGTIPVEIPIKGGDMIVVPEAGKVLVEGEVEKTGSYELGRQMSLLGSLAAAGGITYSAKVDEIEIIRDNGGEVRNRLIVDLQKISTGEERDIKLKNGDIIKVPSHSGRRLRQDTFESITKIINFGVGGSVSMGP